jgi:hypothetical protein
LVRFLAFGVEIGWCGVSRRIDGDSSRVDADSGEIDATINQGFGEKGCISISYPIFDVTIWTVDGWWS